MHLHTQHPVIWTRATCEQYVMDAAHVSATEGTERGRKGGVTPAWVALNEVGSRTYPLPRRYTVLSRESAARLAMRCGATRKGPRTSTCVRRLGRSSEKKDLEPAQDERTSTGSSAHRPWQPSRSHIPPPADSAHAPSHTRCCHRHTRWGSACPPSVVVTCIRPPCLRPAKPANAAYW